MKSMRRSFMWAINHPAALFALGNLCFCIALGLTLVLLRPANPFLPRVLLVIGSLACIWSNVRIKRCLSDARIVGFRVDQRR